MSNVPVVGSGHWMDPAGDVVGVNLAGTKGGIEKEMLTIVVRDVDHGYSMGEDALLEAVFGDAGDGGRVGLKRRQRRTRKGSDEKAGGIAGKAGSR